VEVDHPIVDVVLEGAVFQVFADLKEAVPKNEV
jgi:hypothetical protein